MLGIMVVGERALELDSWRFGVWETLDDGADVVCLAFGVVLLALILAQERLVALYVFPGPCTVPLHAHPPPPKTSHFKIQ